MRSADVEQFMSLIGSWPGRSPVAAAPTEAARGHRVAGFFTATDKTISTVQRYEAMSAYAVEISALLMARGVRHAFLRGLITAATYPTPSLRRFSDLDVLIRRTDGLTVSDVLAPLGLRMDETETVHLVADREKRLPVFLGRAFLPNGEDLVLEVHHRLRPAYVGGADPAAAMLNDATTVGGLPALAPLDRAVELLVHIEGKTRHLPALRAGRDLRLGLYADYAGLLWSTGLDPAEVLAHADRRGVGLIAAAGAAACAEVRSDRTVGVPVHYFTRGGYEQVAELHGPFSKRLRAGSSVPFLRWLVPPHELDESRVLHPHSSTPGSRVTSGTRHQPRISQ
jgi:hypothetical protein